MLLYYPILKKNTSIWLLAPIPLVYILVLAL
jgi:hypothetical protein